ncbi:MFS transporter [Ornithinimicrobium faecis]|uniref:MFS transporter n=1 Tax=Ornithinimicrobium faecis TaxID=2934158 RepID=UPI002118B22D|nr:MFS transporter [Ornithinimicrobium sp. HY1745]
MPAHIPDPSSHPDPSRNPEPAPSTGRPLILSNALDAAGRNTADLATDVLAVVVLGATAAQMGLLNALGTLAFLVLGIPIGVLVDRSPTVRLLLASGLVRAALLASLVLAWSLDGLTLLHLYAVATLAGTAAVVVETTQTAIAPRAVGVSGVSRLVSRMQSAESVISLVVPALAGVLVALTGAGPTLAVAAALTAFAALVVLRLRLAAPEQPTVAADQDPTGSAGEEPEAATTALARFLREGRLGWSTLRERRTLWRLTLGSMLINLGLAVHSAVEVVLVLRELDLGATVLGLLVSAGGVGGLLGSLVAVPLADRLGVPRVLRGSVLLLAPVAALTLTALLDPHRATAWLLAGSFCWGVAIVTYNVLLAGIAAELTPTELMGRVSATRRTLTMGIVPVGGIAGGLHADQAGLVATITAWIVLNAIGAAVVATTSFPRDQSANGPAPYNPA